MLFLILGALTLVLLMGGLKAFESARVTTIKSFMTWVAALGGLILAGMLFLTGRGAVALGALSLFGPLLWRRWQDTQPNAAWQGTHTRAQGARAGSAMTIEEALQVLGLQPGASEAEIRAAHIRLMQRAHPDAGGSDWLASRVNQARDVLLARSRSRSA